MHHMQRGDGRIPDLLFVSYVVAAYLTVCKLAYARASMYVCVCVCVCMCVCMCVCIGV